MNDIDNGGLPANPDRGGPSVETAETVLVDGVPVVRWTYPDGTRVELVAPDQARELLATLPEQRDLKPIKVAQHVRAMLAGDWDARAKPLMLDRRGRLIEGKHRLTALVEAGLPQWFVVYRGVGPEMFLKVDAEQNPKNIEQVLVAKGVQRGLSRIIAAALRMAWRRQNGHKLLDDKVEPRIQEAWELFLTKRWEFEEAARLARRTEKVSQASGVLAFHLYRGLQLDPARTQKFVEAITDGAGLSRGNPALLLRNWLLELRAKRLAMRRLPMAVAYHHALKAYLEGEKNATSWGKIGVEWDQQTLDELRGHGGARIRKRSKGGEG